MSRSNVNVSSTTVVELHGKYMNREGILHTVFEIVILVAKRLILNKYKIVNRSVPLCLDVFFLICIKNVIKVPSTTTEITLFCGELVFSAR